METENRNGHWPFKKRNDEVEETLKGKVEGIVQIEFADISLELK
jgi:hypothetical protein